MDNNPIRDFKIKVQKFTDQNIRLNKNDELGYFQYGSSIIVLFEKEKITWNSDMEIGKEVKVCEALGNMNQKELQFQEATLREENLIE